MKSKVTGLLLSLILLFLLILPGCSGAQETASAPEELTVSAAASLTEPLNEIIALFEKASKAHINVNYGSSGALQKQIEEGAPVDLFISAGKKQIDTLLEKKLADQDSYQELLGNSLVLIVSNSFDKSITSLEELKDKDIKLVLGEVSSVPVGQYAKEYLENVSLYSAFESKIVYAKDVKSVLNYVETGDAEAGIVYASDAVGLKSSYIAYEVPQDAHKKIVYPLVTISQSKHKELGNSFITFLNQKEAKDIFKKYNFKVEE